MTIKLLLPAYGKHGASIVAVDGQLRVVDRPKRVCHGFANGCLCGECIPDRRQKSERAAKRAASPAQCRCEHGPMVDDERRCARCGKQTRRAA